MLRIRQPRLSSLPLPPRASTVALLELVIEQKIVKSVTDNSGRVQGLCDTRSQSPFFLASLAFPADSLLESTAGIILWGNTHGGS